MMALGATERASFTSTLRRIGRDISVRPLILATVGGFAVSAIGLGLPGPVDALASLLGQAAAPAAHFVVGLMLSERPVGRVPADVSVLVAIKLVAHPVIAYLLLSWIGGFDPIWVASAVLMASLPPAGDVLDIARHYRSYVARASTAVLFGALASVATITIALVLVVLRLLPLEAFR
jgi:predicted permease